MKPQQCSCQCGHVQFEVTAQPRLRMLCHCTICQKFNAASHADVVVFSTKDINPPSDELVKFKRHKAPPNVNRGQCVKCGQAAIETFVFPLLPRLTMVPAAMFSEAAELPESKAHMFYERRVADADDELPKHHGFVSSQLAFFKYLWFH
jgi:hypothetical protein